MTVAAAMALIDRPWSRAELAAVLGESDDPDATIECRAALRESRDPATRAIVEAWEVQHPGYGEVPWVSARCTYAMCGGIDSALLERMDRLRDRILSVRDRVPPNPSGIDGGMIDSGARIEPVASRVMRGMTIPSIGWRRARALSPGDSSVDDTFDMDGNNLYPVLARPDDVVRGRRPGLAFPISDGPVEADDMRRRLSCRRLEGALGAARAWKPPQGIGTAISVAPGEVTVEVRARATGRATTVSFTSQRSPFEVQAALRQAAVALFDRAA